MVNWARENAGRAPSTMTPSSQEDARELKACPFCSDPTGPGCAGWNTRPTPDRTDDVGEMVEKLRETIDFILERWAIDNPALASQLATYGAKTVSEQLQDTLLSLQRDRDALREALDELLNYSGGSDNALDDPYVVERARALLHPENEE